MDAVFAKLKSLRVAPKKVRQVTRLLKGMSFNQAEAHLRYMPQKSVSNLRKLLLSAAANAENNFNLSRQDLFVLKILVDPGPTLKRMMPRARGRGEPINKRTSHITIFLAPKTGLRSGEASPRYAEGSSKASKKIDSPSRRAMAERGKAKIDIAATGKSKKARVHNQPIKSEKGRKTFGIKQKVFSRKVI